MRRGRSRLDARLAADAAPGRGAQTRRRGRDPAKAQARWRPGRHKKHARSSTNLPGRCGYHRSGFLAPNVRHISLKTRRALNTRVGVSCRHGSRLKRAHALRASSRARKQSPPPWRHRTLRDGPSSTWQCHGLPGQCPGSRAFRPPGFLQVGSAAHWDFPAGHCSPARCSRRAVG